MIKKIINKIFPRKCFITFTTSKQAELLQGKNIFVTGGSSGIGYAIAKKLIDSGANVIIAGSNLEKLEKASEKLKCKFIQWDVSNMKLIETKIKELNKLVSGKLDSFVNCAGIYKDIRYNECTEEDWANILNINLKGAYFITNAIINNFFIKFNKGNIVFIASNRGIFGDDGPYGISKAGLINYGSGIAKKLLSKNIRVNIVNPGMTASNINGLKDTDNLYHEYVRGKRVIAAQEIAEVVCFLISDQSSCITGQILNCDNGESIL